MQLTIIFYNLLFVINDFKSFAYFFMKMLLISNELYNLAHLLKESHESKLIGSKKQLKDYLYIYICISYQLYSLY